MHLYYRDLELRLTENVYMPEDDSYLLAECVDAVDGERVLDVGTGTGIQAMVAARTASEVVGIDVNRHAVNLARFNATMNEIGNVEFRESDLFENVTETFDLILFNPPYLPVDEDDKLGRAWSGGVWGMEVISRFLSDVGDHLKPDGRFLLLISSLNEVEKVGKEIEKNGFVWEEVGAKKVAFEELIVLKGTHA